ncbi:hypothetical protein [Dactylosporangium matsuzakiense]|uniref:Condensation domain-containing protein n=1 Tax=Dactylosporangium matsuzakiense TaxID=53360 RepID=A0A9W6NJL3_9ACTN|nr:hypothetical protein [Dactylosporangium matsuzakiense]GLK99170.1 hypothetical protein GCM10017581_009110 [Dactylosporangium matsuzakiense]
MSGETGGRPPIRVDYEQASAGEGPLTWAQRFMWDVIRAAGDGPGPFDLLLVERAPAPVATADAVALVHGLLLRHPVLRTQVQPGPAGTVIQRVRPSGTVTVTVLAHGEVDVEHIRGDVPDTTFTDVCRPAFVADESGVHCIVMRINHLAADRWGLDVIAADVRRGLAGGDPAAGPASPSPLDLARFEASPPGRDVLSRAVAHATALYEVVPPTMWLRAPHAPEAERFWFGRLRSARLLNAIGELVQRRRLRVAGILVGAFATVAASALGLDSAFMRTISNNRFDADWAGYPGPLAQEALMHVPLAPTVAGTMRAALPATLRALQVARYDIAVLQDTERDAEQRRGVEFDKLGSTLVLNLFSDLGTAPATDVAVTPTTFTWTGSTNFENLAVYIDAQATEQDFVLHLRLDTTRLTPAEAEAWLRAIEWTVVTAAERDVTTAEVHDYLMSGGKVSVAAEAARTSG